MNKEIAEMIVDHSNGDLELHEEYSGRGMYGKTTCAVSGDHRDVMSSIAYVFELLINEALDATDDKDHEDILNRSQELSKFLGNMSTDSLGRQTIYY